MESIEAVSCAEAGGEADAEASMSKSQRKRQNYLRRLKSRRREEKLQRRRRQADAARLAAAKGLHVPKHVQRKESEARLLSAMEAGSGSLQMAVDCSMEGLMSVKEVGKLAQQFGRLYGSNRRRERPVHLWLVGLQEDGALMAALRRCCDGFDSYHVSRRSAAAREVFAAPSVIYLSPDSARDLTVDDLDGSKVLVLGGLVDENPLLRTTLQRATQSDLRTARLPLAQHCRLRDPRAAILPINIVGDIVLDVAAGGEWREAVGRNIPPRLTLSDVPDAS